MSEDADETENYASDLLRHEKRIADYTERAMAQEIIRWDRDAIHWRNLQEAHKLRLKVDYACIATNIVLAICAIISARKK
jgi:hypothetical protein